MTDSPPAVKPRCHVPWQQMVIDSTGFVVPCCYWAAYGNKNVPVGNLNEASLTEIWNGPAFQKLRANMAKGDLKAAGCADCVALKQGLEMGLQAHEEALAPAAPATPYAENLRQLKAEVAAGATTMKALPTIVSFTPSHACNFRCTHCYQDSTRDLNLKRVRAEDEVLGLLPVLKEIVAGGGEPFMLPVWKRLLKDFKKETNPYLEFGTTTNGSFLDDETVAKLSAFNKVTLNFSIDAVHKELFESIRLRSNWDEVHANLQRCLAKRGAPGDLRWNVSACAVIMRSNFDELPEFLRFMAKNRMPLGLSPCNVEPIDECLTVFNDPARDLPAFRAKVDEAKRLFDTDPVLQEPAFKPFRAHVDVIERMIPFRLASVPHARVRGTAPAVYGERFAANGRGLVPLLVAIFPLDASGAPAPAAAYYAPLREDLSFEVSLPEGEFLAGIIARNGVPNPDRHWRLQVRGGVLRSWYGTLTMRVFQMVPLPIRQRVPQGFKDRVTKLLID